MGKKTRTIQFYDFLIYLIYIFEHVFANTNTNGIFAYKQIFANNKYTLLIKVPFTN